MYYMSLIYFVGENDDDYFAFAAVYRQARVRVFDVEWMHAY